MMFTWIDGHLVLCMLVAPFVAFLVIGHVNLWLARRHANRGGAR